VLRQEPAMQDEIFGPVLSVLEATRAVLSLTCLLPPKSCPTANKARPNAVQTYKAAMPITCVKTNSPSLAQVDTFDEAVAIENANPYGNAAAIYTMSGQTALETVWILFASQPDLPEFV